MVIGPRQPRHDTEEDKGKHFMTRVYIPELGTAQDFPDEYTPEQINSEIASMLPTKQPGGEAPLDTAQEHQRLADAALRDSQEVERIRAEEVDPNAKWANTARAAWEGANESMASQFTGLGNLVNAFGENRLGNFLREGGEYGQTYYGRRKQAFTDPETDFSKGIWQGKEDEGILGGLGRTVRGGLAESGPTALFALESALPATAASKVLGLAGKSAKVLSAASKPVQKAAQAAIRYERLVGGLPRYLQAGTKMAPFAIGQRLAEGVAEGGGVGHEANLRGRSLVEQREAVIDAVKGNLPLAAIDVLQASLVIGSLPDPAQKLLMNVSRKYIGQIPMKVLKSIAGIAAGGVLEGQEEAIQEEISSWALGEGFDPKVVWNPAYAREKHPESFNIGALTGVAQAGGHIAFNSVISEKLDKVDPSQLDEVIKERNLTPDEERAFLERIQAEMQEGMSESGDPETTPAKLVLAGMDPLTEDEVDPAIVEKYLSVPDEELALEAEHNVAEGLTDAEVVQAYRARLAEEEDVSASTRKKAKKGRQREADLYNDIAARLKEIEGGQRTEFAKQPQAARRAALEDGMEAKPPALIPVPENPRADIRATTSQRELLDMVNQFRTLGLMDAETTAAATKQNAFLKRKAAENMSPPGFERFVPGGSSNTQKIADVSSDAETRSAMAAEARAANRAKAEAQPIADHIEGAAIVPAGENALAKPEDLEAPAIEPEAEITDEQSPLHMDKIRNSFKKIAESVQPTASGAKVTLHNGTVGNIEVVDFINPNKNQDAVAKHGVEDAGSVGVPGIHITHTDGSFTIQLARGVNFETHANMQTLDHEVFHVAMKSDVFSVAEKASVLNKFFKQALKEFGINSKMKVRDALTDPNADVVPNVPASKILAKAEELAADDFGSWAPKHKGMISKAWNWLKKLASTSISDLSSTADAERVYEKVRDSKVAGVQPAKTSAPATKAEEKPSKPVESTDEVDTRLSKIKEKLDGNAEVSAQVRKGIAGVKPAIWTENKVYTGIAHYEAFEKALDDDPSLLADNDQNRWMDGFLFPDGTFRNRAETLARIGVETSEELAAVKAGKKPEEAYEGFGETNPEVSDDEIAALARSAQVRFSEEQHKAAAKRAAELADEFFDEKWSKERSLFERRTTMRILGAREDELPTQHIDGSSAQVRPSYTDEQLAEAQRRGEEDAAEMFGDVQNRDRANYARRRTMRYLGVEEADLPNTYLQKSAQVRKELGEILQEIDRGVSAQVRGTVPDTPEFKKWFSSASDLMKNEDGSPVDLFHGTFFDINEIDLSKSDERSFLGRGFYTSTSPVDASDNYASTNGPDQRNKLELSVEEIENEVENRIKEAYGDEDFREVAKEIIERYDVKLSGREQAFVDELIDDIENGADDSNRFTGEAFAELIARKRIVNDGAARVYKLWMNLKNPFVLGKTTGVDDGTQTVFNYEYTFDEETEETTEGGSAVELFDAIFDVLNLEGGRDFGVPILEEFQVNLEESGVYYYDGDPITARDMYDALMKSRTLETLSEAEEVESGELIRRIVEHLGHDGAVMEADVLHMENVAGVRHFITWNPGSVKSAFSDKQNAESAEISAQVRYQFQDNAQQEIGSADTSLRQRPATFKKVLDHFTWEPGTVNADLGGGRYDLFTDALDEVGVENVVWDRFNRSDEHNSEALKRIVDGQADTVTVNNVLNVIREGAAQRQTVENAHNVLKEGGTAYFLMHEGNKSGKGATSPKGWQRNEKIDAYLPMIQEVFPGAYKKHGLIIAHKEGSTVTAQVRQAPTRPPGMSQEEYNLATEPSGVNDPRLNAWFGGRETAMYHNQRDARRLRKELAEIAGQKNWAGSYKYGQKAVDLAKALHVYIDMKREPSARDKYYDELSNYQKRIVDMAENEVANNPRLVEFAKTIQDEYKEVGERAKKEGLIHNLLENFVNRQWLLDGRPASEANRSFGTTTRHRKKRVLPTILQGWADGLDMATEDVISNLTAYKDEIARTSEDKASIARARRTRLNSDPDSPFLLTHIRPKGHKYEEIKHPNYRYYVVDGTVTKGVITEKPEGDNYAVKGDRLEFRKYSVMKPGAKRSSAVFETWEKAKAFADTHPGFEIHERWDRMRAERLYAPKEMADNLNAILAPGWQNKYVKTVLKYNAIIKGYILLTSFFHHQAFARSFWLGTNGKPLDSNGEKFSKMRIFKAYQEGMKMIDANQEEIEFLVSNGLTLGQLSDWDDLAFADKSAFQKWIDNHGKVSRAIRDKATELRQRQSAFLFKNFGAGLKAQAALIELRHNMKKFGTDGSMTPTEVAQYTARLINEDFGGLNWDRMGVSKNKQQLMKVLLLAPDWTGSNFLTIKRLVQATLGKGKNPEQVKKIYQRFWVGVIMKGVLATTALNIMMASLGGLTDDEEGVLSGLNRAREEDWQRLHWLDADVTPIYQLVKKATGGNVDGRRRYFSVIGHFKDPIRWALDPIRSAKHKGSPLARMFMEAFTGSDWKGDGFTTASELFGTDDKGYYKNDGPGYRAGDPKGGQLRGKFVSRTTKPGVLSVSVGDPSETQLISYLASQVKGSTPVQVQEFFAVLEGQRTAFDGIARSIGLHMSPGHGTAFDALSEKVQEFSSEMNALATTDRKKRAEERRNNPELVRAERGLEQALSKIRKIKKQIVALEASGSKSKSSKAELKEKYEERIQKIEHDFVKRYGGSF
jgi:hypothetical protein